MGVLKQHKKTSASPDFSLILSRLENEIIHGDNIEKSRRIISNDSIWKQLTSSYMIKWARLAQMAGAMDTALNVLTAVNKKEPENQSAWLERIDLLVILDRRSDLAGVLAMARPFIGEKNYKKHIQQLTSLENQPVQQDMEFIPGPFERLRQNQSRIDHFMNLFSGREDCFARQWVNRKEDKQGYVPVRSSMTAKDIKDHLNNRKTYGIYLLKSDSSVKVAVIDADLTTGFRQRKLKKEEKNKVQRERNYLISRIKETAQKAGFEVLIEFSGNKGYHFWFAFEKPIPAETAKTFLLKIKNMIGPDISSFNLEVFPKQNRLSSKGLGNLIKLPLGVHRLSGKKSYFIECKNRNLEAQLDFLMEFKPSSVDGIYNFISDFEKEKIVLHPRWQKWSDKYPELSTLESKCPPLAQIVSSCRNGVTLSAREEKIIFQTIGFLSRSKTLLHYLFAFSPEYNPHLVDYKISRLRGTPLGCKRIHSTLSFAGDMCEFDSIPDYRHPLLHISKWTKNNPADKSEKVDSLTTAMENLKISMDQVKRFLK